MKKIGKFLPFIIALVFSVLTLSMLAADIYTGEDAETLEMDNYSYFDQLEDVEDDDLDNLKDFRDNMKENDQTDTITYKDTVASIVSIEGARGIIAISILGMAVAVIGVILAAISGKSKLLTKIFTLLAIVTLILSAIIAAAMLGTMDAAAKANPINLDISALSAILVLAMSLVGALATGVTAIVCKKK